MLACCPRAWADWRRRRARCDLGDGGASRGGIGFGQTGAAMVSRMGDVDMLVEVEVEVEVGRVGWREVNVGQCSSGE